MLVLFASPRDPTARALAERWARHDAAVLTSRDLSRPGWRHDPDRPEAGRAVIAGRGVEAGAIAGVLVRWPAVFEQELAHIEPSDRCYVAAEMTAFLRSWLTRLPCPVVNRPTATSLIGPSWRPEQWVHAAARLGIPARPVRRRVVPAGAGTGPAVEAAPHATVTVAGDRCFGDVHPALASHARRLAAAAGVTLLAVHFGGGDRDAPLLSADLLPDLTDDGVIDAVLACLLARRGRGRQAA